MLLAYVLAVEDPARLATIVAAAKRGDRAAFAELYRRFHRAVHGVVLAKVPFRDAADLVQDTFATALSRLPQLTDETGVGSIAVSSGMVELASSGGVIIAPAGTRARLLAGRKPSVPVIERAIPGLVDAVEAFESGDLTAIDRVLGASGPEDAITVVSLAMLVPAAQKLTVLGRLAALVPPPDAITPDSAAVSPSELQRWRDAVVAAHFAH